MKDTTNQEGGHSTATVKFARPDTEDYQALSSFMLAMEYLTTNDFLAYHSYQDVRDCFDADTLEKLKLFDFFKENNGEDCFDLKAFIREAMLEVGHRWRRTVFAQAVVQAATDSMLDHLEWHPVLREILVALDSSDFNEWHLVYEYHDESGKSKFPANCVLKGAWATLSEKHIALAWYVDALHTSHGFAMERQEHSTHIFLPVSNMSAVVFDRDVFVVGNKMFLRYNGIHFVEIK